MGSVRLLICLITAQPAMLLLSSASETLDFNRDVQPILAGHCIECHGPDSAARKGKLRLDRGDGLTDDRGGYRILVPGKPEASELVARITHADTEERMPPADFAKKKPLKPEQIEILKRWIATGANYEAHWAFRPIQRHAPPDVKQAGLTEIDRFIVAALSDRGLALSPPATRAQLIRRATFDLTGLPPEWSDVEAFINDPGPYAFARVIDRLQASPAYGERWGRHWLDLARYADTHGGGAIGFERFPFSYTYRDYVIAAFNADLPYNRFLLEQLAADQLKLAANDPPHAALGFLTVGMQFGNRHDQLDDQIDVITRGLLGLAALLMDLEQRGLLEETLVLCTGEFGRTPTVELGIAGGGATAGRDHNHWGFSLWMAGGGIKGGTIYGATEEFGFKAVENPVSVHDLHATILHLLGIDHRRLTYRHAGRDFRLTDVHGHVVKDVLA